MYDIHLSALDQRISQQIRTRAITLYSAPFASIRLNVIAAAFGCRDDDMRSELARLIEDGKISAKIDLHRMV